MMMLFVGDIRQESMCAFWCAGLEFCMEPGDLLFCIEVSYYSPQIKQQTNQTSLSVVKPRSRPVSMATAKTCCLRRCG